MSFHPSSRNQAIMFYRRSQRPNRSSGSNHPTKESTNMKKFGLATIAAGGLAAAILGLAAPADAAPAGPGNAQDTVNAFGGPGLPRHRQQARLCPP